MVESRERFDGCWEDWVGHSAIANYYGIDQGDFIHHASMKVIPACIAKDVNAGRMKKLAAAYHPEAPKWRYTVKSSERGMRGRVSDLSLMSTIDAFTPYPHPVWDKFSNTLRYAINRKVLKKYRKEVYEYIEAGIRNDADPFGDRGRGCPILRTIGARFRWADAPDNVESCMPKLHDALSNCRSFIEEHVELNI